MAYWVHDTKSAQRPHPDAALVAIAEYVKKFELSVDAHFEPRQAARVNALFASSALYDMPVNEFMDAMVVK